MFRIWLIYAEFFMKENTDETDDADLHGFIFVSSVTICVIRVFRVLFVLRVLL